MFRINMAAMEDMPCTWTRDRQRDRVRQSETCREKDRQRVRHAQRVRQTHISHIRSVAGVSSQNAFQQVMVRTTLQNKSMY